MRVVVFFLIIFSTTTSIAEDLQIPITHKIKKVEKDSTISSDTCIIYGKVYVNGEVLPLTKVSSYDHAYSSVTDSTGYYAFKVPINDSMITSDSLIYAFKSGFNENIVELPINGGQRIEVDFYMSENNRIEVVLKPVIYLYNTSEREIDIRLNPQGKFTYTYPKYNNGWKVKANEEGTISYGDKKLPYLFWEAEQKGLNFVADQKGNKKGFFINTDTTISFLENALKKLGLNDKEKTDFITFWGPKIMIHEHANIQFLIDEDYHTEIGSMEITPKPNSIRRIYILVEHGIISLSSFSKEQVLPSFSREGFTVIEWGGTFLPYNCGGW